MEKKKTVKKCFKKITAEIVVKEEKNGLLDVAPRQTGRLDMVIAFDTTGSMAAYIDNVRKQVSELIPRLFEDNDDLRIGIVAFGDYCDMPSRDEFGSAYQCLKPTDNIRAIKDFIRKSKDTCGGDGDEFYELVIRKIVRETPWRRGSTRSILLISDAGPHPVGYTYADRVVDSQIDWRNEARLAARRRIKIDTVTINPLPWYKTLSAMTNGVSVPFASDDKTSDLIYVSTLARGSVRQRERFDEIQACCTNPEMADMMTAYRKVREEE